MKKISKVLVVLLFAVALTACGGSDEEKYVCTLDEGTTVSTATLYYSGDEALKVEMVAASEAASKAEAEASKVFFDMMIPMMTSELGDDSGLEISSELDGNTLIATMTFDLTNLNDKAKELLDVDPEALDPKTFKPSMEKDGFTCK